MTPSPLSQQRTKDVLFALKAAGECKKKLGRLALQKIIYLSDILLVSWRAIGAQAGFRPWHNGPYDLAIQNAVDRLAFRGIVEIDNLSFRKLRNAGCNYSLTESGLNCVDELCKNQSLNDDFLLFREIASQVNSRGWENIQKIVYAEPTYGTARAKRQPLELPVGDPHDNLTTQILRNLKNAFEADRALPISRESMVQLLFSILDEYRNLPEASRKP